MPRKSAIDALDPAIRSAVLYALGDGATIDEIVELVEEMGGRVSRSSAGRYAKNFAELAKEHRQLRATAEAFGREFGAADDHQGRMMIQLMTSITTRALMPHLTGEAEEELSTLELSRLAKAVKETTSAAKVDVEREARIREEERKRAREEAARDAVAGARAAGASDDTLRAIWAALGVSA